MENRDNQTPETSQQADLSKAQSPQQPTGQQSQAQQPTDQSQQRQPSDQASSSGQFDSQQSQPAETGQADYGNAGQSDTTTQQRSDIEGGTATGQASDIEGSSSFVGGQSQDDTSSELVEDDDSSDFARDGQGAAE